jgi:serine/threonine protein kinase
MEWQYRAIELKGRGACGDVYQVEDLIWRRTVAKKVLRVRNEETLKRFKRDDAMLRKYDSSPYFVDLYESDVDGPHPYLILEYAPLGSLQSSVGRLTDWKRGARWLRDISHGLEEMHVNGDMHRDIKPGNLLLFEHDREIVKFTDFGYGLNADTTGPLTNSVFGTIGYADPKAIQRGAYFPEADIFAAGRTMTALFTGSPQPSLFASLPGPTEFRSLITRMMSPVIENRPTPREIYQTLDKLLAAAERPVLPLPIISSGGLAKIGLAAIAAVVLWNSNDWDDNVGRYRNAKGQFASNWL